MTDTGSSNSSRSITIFASIIALIALVCGFIGNFVDFGLPFFVYALCGLVSLWIGAFVALRRDPDRFDAQLNAESIVAFGVMSLVFGMLIAGAEAPAVLEAVAQGPEALASGLRSVGFHLLEGLFFAGVCPFSAVVIRQLGLQNDPDIGSSSIDAAAIASSAETLNAALRKHADAVEESLASLASATGRHSSAIAEDSEKLARGLANASKQISEVSVALEAFTNQTTTLTQALDKLETESQRSTDLMEALSNLIAQVERFTRSTSK